MTWSGALSAVLRNKTLKTTQGGRCCMKGQIGSKVGKIMNDQY